MFPTAARMSANARLPRRARSAFSSTTSSLKSAGEYAAVRRASSSNSSAWSVAASHPARFRMCRTYASRSAPSGSNTGRWSPARPERFRSGARLSGRAVSSSQTIRPRFRGSPIILITLPNRRASVSWVLAPGRPNTVSASSIRMITFPSASSTFLRRSNVWSVCPKYIPRRFFSTMTRRSHSAAHASKMNVLPTPLGPATRMPVGATDGSRLASSFCRRVSSPFSAVAPITSPIVCAGFTTSILSPSSLTSRRLRLSRMSPSSSSFPW